MKSYNMGYYQIKTNNTQEIFVFIKCFYRESNAAAVLMLEVIIVDKQCYVQLHADIAVPLCHANKMYEHEDGVHDKGTDIPCENHYCLILLFSPLPSPRCATALLSAEEKVTNFRCDSACFTSFFFLMSSFFLPVFFLTSSFFSPC